jgi:hypothetical protein
MAACRERPEFFDEPKKSWSIGGIICEQFEQRIKLL